MFTTLPSELILEILKHVSVAGIAACVATCKTLKEFVDQYESTIYRQAAAHPDLHLIPHDSVSFDRVLSKEWHSERFLGDANDWKNLCRRGCQVRSSWLGKGPSRIKEHQNRGDVLDNVHRIKVDEKRGFFIVSHRSGGISVRNISDNSLLWALPPHYVRPYAHCEYGEGFLIFDRFGGTKEVWHCNDTDWGDVVSESEVDVHQKEANERVILPHQSRIRFLPHALIRPPGDVPSRAYRFVYPTLLVGGYNTLLFWDIRDGKLIDRINNIQRPIWFWDDQRRRAARTEETVITNSSVNTPNTHPETHHDPIRQNSGDILGEISYVEVNNNYAFICGSGAFRVFRRHAQDSQMTDDERRDAREGECVLELQVIDLAGFNQRWPFQVEYVEPHEMLVSEVYQYQEPEVRLRTPSPRWSDSDSDEESDDDTSDDGLLLDRHREYRKRPWAHKDKVVVSHSIKRGIREPDNYMGLAMNTECQSAHVSPCGQHIAILCVHSKLLLLPYFERVINGEATLSDIKISIQLNFAVDSVYLAYEEDIIGVVTELGVYIIHPTFPHPSDLETAPKIRVERVTFLNNPYALGTVSCLQMTSTALWLNWHMRRIPVSDDPLVVENLENEIEDREVEYEETYKSLVNGTRRYFNRRAMMGIPDTSVVYSVDFGLGA